MPEKQLSWQPGFSLLRKPARRPAPRRNRQQGFEFIEEYPQREHRAKCSPSVTTYTHSEFLSNPSREDSIIVDTHIAPFQNGTVEENEPPIDPSLETLNDESSTRSERFPDLETIEGTNEPRLNSCNNEDHSTSFHLPEPRTGERNVAGSGPNTAAVSALTNIPLPLFTSIPPTIEYSSLTQRFRPILNRCMHFVYTFSLPNSD
jgi:hypothetical protein